MLITEGQLIWPLLPPDKPTTTPPATDEQWAEAQSVAIDWLWGVSGRKYGTREALLRPQSLCAVNVGHWSGVLGYMIASYGVLFGAPGDVDTSWAAQRVLQLPGPAQSVEVVTIVDGSGVSSVLSSSAYRLDGDYLVRTDGGTWPTTQDLISNMGAPNTWSIEYTRGSVVPVGGQLAAALLAASWLQLIMGNTDACKLPWNTVSASRSGVTVQLQLSTAYRTSGIAGVDRWVSSVNPAGLTQPPRIWSPDVRRDASPYAGSAAAYVAPLPPA